MTTSRGRTTAKRGGNTLHSWDERMDAAPASKRGCRVCANVRARDALREALENVVARRNDGRSTPPTTWLLEEMQRDYGLDAGVDDPAFRRHLRLHEKDRYRRAYPNGR